MAVTKYCKVLGFQWPTQDPFLFLAHHQDAYPVGTEDLGPEESTLSGRSLGKDFDLSRDWKMYHGYRIPGFPVHPHRGFETVTVVLEGFVDHFDSAGGSGRYGMGDVQWMTAGAGLQHAEMFPLLSQTLENPLHLFQIWLNLPSANKFVPPHYQMLWREDIPIVTHEGALVTVVAGEFCHVKAPAPAPNSCAADENNKVSIWLMRLPIGARVVLRAQSKTVNQSLYNYRGGDLKLIKGDFEKDGVGVAGVEVAREREIEILPSGQMAALVATDITLEATQAECFCLYLAAEPIGEPVAQYGPFVMNTKSEIQQAYWDYERTKFGGWPWKTNDPVHPVGEGRIAKYPDGTISKPPETSISET